MNKLINPFLIIIFAVILRLIPHPPNVAPIAALALFGGAYLNKKYALAAPFLAMVISDLFLGFHNTIIFVYGSFFLTGLLGIWLRAHKTVSSVFFTTILSSLLFFLITNFGVWLVSGLYPKTLDGLFQSYFYALPFFRNTLTGDLLYAGLFFGGYEILFSTISAKLKAQSAK